MMRRTNGLILITAVVLATGGVGCELISQVDRSQIGEAGGAGGTGGTAESSSSSSSAGGAGGMGGMGGAGGMGGVGGGIGGAGGGTGGAGGGTGGAGGGTGGAGGGTGGAGGSGPVCVTPTDCPPTANECITLTCIGGVCGTDFVAAGTPVAQQSIGDCKVDQCDGAGSVTTVNDDADVPDDQNDCTDNQCKNGAASNPPLVMGTMCGASGNLFCDGLGACVGCVGPSDCQGSDTTCAQRTCVNGMCGVSFAGAGTVVGNPTAGDCKQDECDGSGNVVPGALDTDLPVDGNQCTNDVCTSGVASNPPTGSGAACTQNGGQFCSGTGACVQCVAANTCPGQDTECQTRACNAGTCGFTNTPAGTVLAMQSVGDCKQNQCDGNGSPTVATDDMDVPNDGNSCTSDVCTSGMPSNPPVAAGTMCGANGVCNAAGQCVGCVTANDCPGQDTECQARVCNAGTCGFSYTMAGTPVAMQTAGDCKQNQCDGNGAIVNNNDNGDVPADDGNQCTDQTCISGNPSFPPLPPGTVCNQNGGTTCNAVGVCVGCVVAADCPGVDTACQTRTCNAGACGFNYTQAGTPTPMQTTGDCKENRCDGMGAIIQVNADSDVPDDMNQCTNDSCIIGNPTFTPVSTGTSCSQNGGTVCDASGLCVNAPSVIATTPSDGAAAIANTTVGVTFSTAMDPGTLTGQTTAGSCLGSIQVSLDNFASCIAFSASAPTMSGGNTIATFTAAPGLLVNRSYKIRVTTGATSATGLALGAAFTQPTGFGTTSPNLCDGTLVISQVYGGGGGGSSTYKNDFIELHNRGTTAISVGSMSIHYASSAGTSWTKTNLTAGSTIPAGGYYLIQLGGGATGLTLPTPDATGGTAMSGTDGKVVLMGDQNTIPAGACPTGNIIDFVGYGAANCSEGNSATPVTSATTAALRLQTGCADVGVNLSDFAVAAPAPRNSMTAAAVCACTVQNESGAALEADYCNVQFPPSLNVAAGASTGIVFGQVYELGITPAPLANANVRAQLGYGLPTVNPEYQTWNWFNAPYNVQNGSNDEYQASFTAPASGSYRYVYRYSLDQGVSWTTCDNNGAGSDPNLTFDFADEAILTVP